MIVIAGAGPVGLALAVGLAHHGVRSVVLEERPALGEHSKAPGILPRTLEIFAAWGVLDRFLERGFFLREPRIWTPGGREPIFTVDFTPLEAMTRALGVLILPQNRTEAILHEIAAATGAVTLVRPDAHVGWMAERPTIDENAGGRRPRARGRRETCYTQPMKTISVRDLRQRWPEAEALLARENELLVTRDGTPVARLVRFREDAIRRKRFDPRRHAAWRRRVNGGKTVRWVDEFLIADRDSR